MSADRIAGKYAVADNGCWVWQHRVEPNGYGRVWDGASVRWAHRVSFETYRGPIPVGHEIDHLCENPPCVNPDHLDPVTRREHNRRTRHRAGVDDRHAEAGRLRAAGLTYPEIARRMDWGSATAAQEAVNSAVRKGLVDPAALPVRRLLTDDDRKEIRSLRAQGLLHKDIADRFGVHPTQICRICKGQTGGHAREVA